MDFDEINQILALMREHDLVEFELERDDLHVRLRKAETPAPMTHRPGSKPSATAMLKMPLPNMTRMSPDQPMRFTR